MVRVLICDDQDVVRKGLNIILSQAEGVEVVGLAEDGQVAVEKAVALKPDVVLMDLKMPTLNGIHATRRITTALPAVKVVVLTTYDADEWVFDAIRAGASGYLLKDADGEEIAAAVRGVVAGEVRLDPHIAGKVLAEFTRLDRSPIASRPDDPGLEQLTERELSILREMAKGKTNQEIAETLFLASGTVKNNVSSIIGKLHANDRTQAVIAALRRGIVSLDE
ncbi:MAG: response regulator transcription factor [Chloroflexi bacterium]|nr:response regulator transcription factor [Chloroflexota bacterium]MCI0578956.1 response regulator transcription factor [Chloroflexota bacterium]MCI0645106.1 response regulator transcription factor [Chloroflexota bacterium]MCI0731941.1 response regulator transcription factor [Chloroflexota bacterium]